ncbi:MAG: hypothetical protein IH840_03700, partial [Candidatus Heimdallarchaeota archaeon]|nr:hypothetical protein [Candidatus Heimdallarchaeota archaeon]
DPCPHPLPAGYNGLEVEWGKSNYVNPPYRKDDTFGATGMTAFIYKAIAENKNRLKMVLGGWTIGSIVGWLLFHPGSYLDSSLLNKVIEVILLVFLFLESREATTT